MAAHEAGLSMSNSSKGAEREAFISNFLERVFPPIFRFGRGDAIDREGNRSGQLDVVIEYPFGISLPAVGSSDVRLYPAESIAAVIEVKSNLASQWGEAQRTGEMLASVTRTFDHGLVLGGPPPAAKIPLYVVAFRGWKDWNVATAKFAEAAQLDAILVIESNFLLFRSEDGIQIIKGGDALWAFISFVNRDISALRAAYSDYYAYLH